MELFDRYLKLVRIFLPRSQQDDIIRELSEDIRSQAEEKELELGRPLNRDEQRKLIGQLGHPALLAGRYGPRRQLIGPELFPFYWLVLKLALGVNALTHVIVLAVALASGQVVNLVLRSISAAGALFVTFGVVTIVFGLLDRYRPTGMTTRPWNPDHLNTVSSHAARVHASSPVSRLFSALIFTLWWLSRLWPGAVVWSGTPVFMLGPAWDSAYLWILLLALGGIARASIDLARPGWRGVRRGLKLAGSAGALAVMVYLLRAGNFVVAVDAGSAARLDHLTALINQGFYWALSIALVIVAAASAIEVRAWTHEQGSPRPPDGKHASALVALSGVAVLLGSALSV